MNLKTKSLNSMLDIHPSFAFLLWLAEDFYLNLLSLTSIFPDGFPLNKLKTGIGILAVVVYFSAVKLLFLMDDLQKIITAFELHSVEGIKECFENGINPNTIINGRPVVYDLIDMYSRGPMFKKCIQVFVESGLKFEDKVLLAVLLDDATSLEAELKSNIEA